MVELDDRSTTMVVDPDRGLLRVTLRGRYDLRAWLELIQAVTDLEYGGIAINKEDAEHRFIANKNAMPTTVMGTGVMSLTPACQHFYCKRQKAVAELPVFSIDIVKNDFQSSSLSP